MSSTDNSSHQAGDRYITKRFVSRNATYQVLTGFADYLMGNTMPDNIDKDEQVRNVWPESIVAKYHESTAMGGRPPPNIDSEVGLPNTERIKQACYNFLQENQRRGDTSYLAFRGRQKLDKIDPDELYPGENMPDDEWERVTHVLSLTHLPSRRGLWPKDEADVRANAPSSDASGSRAEGDQAQDPSAIAGADSETRPIGLIRAFVMNLSIYDWDRGDTVPDPIPKLEFDWVPGDHSATRTSFDEACRTEGTGLRDMSKDVHRLLTDGSDDDLIGGPAETAWVWGSQALRWRGEEVDLEFQNEEVDLEIQNELFEEMLNQHPVPSSSD